MLIGQTTAFVHAMARLVLGPGGLAIDATVGKGHDTLFLAELAGETGHVYGFDIQEEALRCAQARLAGAGLDRRATLLPTGHETMGAALPPHIRGRVDVVLFNLGYLPGSDGRVVTRAETTCAAIDAGLELLRSGGLLSLVLYTGHPGGPEEARAVERHCEAISTQAAQVMRCTMHNHADPKVRVLLLEKRQAPPNVVDRA